MRHVADRQLFRLQSVCVDGHDRIVASRGVGNGLCDVPVARALDAGAGEGEAAGESPSGDAGLQVWNKQRKDEVLIDVHDVALGHTAKQRRNDLSRVYDEAPHGAHPACGFPVYG